MYRLIVLVLAFVAFDSEAQPVKVSCPAYTVPFGVTSGICWNLGDLSQYPEGGVTIFRACPPRHIRFRDAIYIRDTYYYTSTGTVGATVARTQTGRYVLSVASVTVEPGAVVVNAVHTVKQSSNILSGSCSYTITVSAQ